MKQNKAHFRSRNAGRKQNGAHVIGVNTVIDSNGPCGKVRGTAIQIMEKYFAAAKDAAASDRVLYENCMQHAEHFFRTHAAAVAAEAERRESMNNSSENDTTTNSDNENINDVEENTDDVEVETEVKIAAEPSDDENKEQSESESESDITSDIMNLDVSFPDVSKMGKPEKVAEVESENQNDTDTTKVATDERPVLTLKRRGRKPKAVSVEVADTATDTAEDNADKPLTFKVETVAPPRRAACRKVQGL